MFVGRELEIQALENMYQKPGFQLMVVYGRRRVGKTFLLNQFVQNKKHLFLTAEEVSDSLNLKKFSSVLGQNLGMNNFPAYEDWNSFFSMIADHWGNQRTIVVIDEYPYAATANKSLNSILQHLIDSLFRQTNIFFILCGSSVSFMENQVLGEKSPLFGRRTGQLKIHPLDYYDAAKFYPFTSNEDKIRYYSVFGGTPYYLSLIDPTLTFEENVRQLYFEMSSYLLNEGILLMKQEFREPAYYNSLLQAIAGGLMTPSEIAGFTKLESGLISKYLITLQDLNLVERVIPFGSNLLKGKKSQYRITENFVMFWYRFVFPFKTEIERGNGEIYLEIAMNNLNEFIGKTFEEITKQYLKRENARNSLPFISKSFGKWWGKGKESESQEIDIVLESVSGKELLIGECKWSSNVKYRKVIETLYERGSLFDGYKIYLYLFTKDPIHFPEPEDIRFINISDYYQKQ